MSKLWEHAQSLWWLIIQDTPFYLYAIRLDIIHGGVYECVRAVMRLQGRKIGKSVETQDNHLWAVWTLWIPPAFSNLAFQGSVNPYLLVKKASADFLGLLAKKAIKGSGRE